MTRLALLCALFSLTACAPSPTRLPAPPPPRIACSERQPAPPLPPLPDPLGLDDIQVVLAQVIGAYEKVVVQRSTTADCLDAARAAGSIR